MSSKLTNYAIKNSKIVTSIILLAVLAGCIRSIISPPDWVAVHLTQVPRDTQAVYLLYYEQERPKAMNVYRWKAIAFTDPPGQVGLNWHSVGDPDEQIGDIQWTSGAKYGLLLQKANKEWLLWPIDPKGVAARRLEKFLFGFGELGIRIPHEDEAERPSKEFIEKLNIAR